MTEAEKRFKESILNKIKKYEIKEKKKNVTINDCLKHAANNFVTTVYYNGEKEFAKATRAEALRMKEDLNQVIKNK